MRAEKPLMEMTEQELLDYLAAIRNERAERIQVKKIRTKEKNARKKDGGLVEKIKDIPADKIDEILKKMAAISTEPSSGPELGPEKK
jgi:GTP1/Obg family GTP-binding protein